MRAAMVVLLTAVGFCGTSCSSAGQAPAFQNLFHLAGIPGVHDEARVNMIPGTDALIFQAHKVHYAVPYARIHQVILLRSDRRYEGRTFLAAIATPYGAGGLLILKKHHMDTAIFDYVNERGGKMGIVVQVETAQGDQLKALLTAKGIAVSEPGGSPAQGSSEKQASVATTQSKP